MRSGENKSVLRLIARGSRGFTLLELLVTLMVAAVLLTAGVPSFVDTIRNNRATANANELVTAFSIAHSEAIRRGARVSVCSSADGESCGGSWADGWIVVSDNAASGAPDEDELLAVWGPPAGNAGVTTAPNGVGWVRFSPRGTAQAAAALPVVYTIEIDGCSGQQAREISLNALGRTTVTRVDCG